MLSTKLPGQWFIWIAFVWSIFDSRTAWADYITCGMSISIVYYRKLEWQYVCLCSIIVLWSVRCWWWEVETRCRLIAFSSRKAPRGPPDLTSPSDGRIAINSTKCLLNTRTAEGFKTRVCKSRYWKETLQFPHPLLWRNEASLLVHWRTMYFPLTLWTLVCVHRVLSAHRPVLLCAQNT